MKIITLRDEQGNVIESKKVTKFEIDLIPREWVVRHNYSVWFEDKTEWCKED